MNRASGALSRREGQIEGNERLRFMAVAGMARPELSPPVARRLHCTNRAMILAVLFQAFKFAFLLKKPLDARRLRISFGVRRSRHLPHCVSQATRMGLRGNAAARPAPHPR